MGSSSSSSSSSRGIEGQAGLGASFVLGAGAGAAFGAGDVLQLTKLAVDDSLDAATRASAMHQLASVLASALLSSDGGEDAGEGTAGGVAALGAETVNAVVEAALFLAKVPEHFTGGQEEGGQGGSASSTSGTRRARATLRL